MSGPKTSRYTLMPEQKRILAEQREFERRMSVAFESIRRNNKRLLQLGSMFSAARQVSGELINCIGSDGSFADKNKELEGIIAPIIAKTNRLVRKVILRILPSLQELQQVTVL